MSIETITVELPANGWRARTYQRPLWEYLKKGGRHAVAVWHRRAGKDEVALHHSCKAAHKRRGNYWHMLPEYKQARKAIWDAINPHTGRKRVDEAFPLELRKSTNQVEMKIEFHCGSIWQVVGSDNFNSLIGSPPVGIVYSEWAVADPRAHGFLRPILAENGGWSLFIYTSRGYNHGFSTYEAARNDPAAFAQRLTADETGVFSPEILESERRAYQEEYGQYEGDALFRQEYYCDFSAANIGAILGRYVEEAEKGGRIADVEYDPLGAPVEISSDIGFRDTAAFWFWQPRYDGYALIDYDEDTGLDASDWIERLKDRYPYGTIWLPHDAKAKTFQSKRSVLEQFMAARIAKRVDIVPQLSIPDRINAARTLMPKCHFNRVRCKAGLDGLRSWSYDYNDETKTYSKQPRHDWACFTPDTEVLTRNGTHRIMNLPINGEVLTPCGWKHYQGPRITRRNARLVEVRFKDGFSVKCTPDHMFRTVQGWKSAESLTPNTEIQSCLIPSRNISTAGYIANGRLRNISRVAARSCIGMLGRARLGRFLAGVTSTIKTAIRAITRYQTLSACRSEITYLAYDTQSIGTAALLHSMRTEPKLRHGTAQKRADCGIAVTRSVQRVGSSGSTQTWPARVAARLSGCWSGKAAILSDSVLGIATPALIESVKPLSERADTCCIHVPDGGCFALANGAVVSNSHPGDGFSYGAVVMRERVAKVEPKPIIPQGPVTIDQFIKMGERRTPRSGRI